MNLIASAPDWLFALFALCLFLAAAIDVWKRKLPNWAALALIGGAIVAVILEGPEWALWQNLLLFAIMLLLGTISFSRGWLGGGDVKTLAATMLWLPLLEGVQALAAIFLVGGLLTVLLLMTRTAMMGASKHNRRIPYGVAIAIGAIAYGLFLRA